MTTATAQAITAPPKARVAGPTSIDFETRLTLAGIGMDVRLSDAGGEALVQAQEAASEAVAAAGTVIAPAPALAAPTFRSNPVLRMAGNIIRARGWVQNTFEAEDGSVCLLQALSLVTDAGPAYAEANEELLARIIAHEGRTVINPAHWNDRPGRTREDVLSLLY